MPTLPLFTPPPAIADASASRQVIAPGGTEWWHVDAEDRESGLLVVADLFAGHPFDPRYANDFEDFLRRPTVLRPPDPRNYAAASLAVYRNGVRVGSLDQRVSRSDFSASSTTLDVRCGPMHLVRANDSQLRLTATAVANAREQISLDLTLTARFEIKALERIVPARVWTGSFFLWVGRCPSCDVTGDVRVLVESGPIQKTGFSGRGYHECVFGEGLLRPLAQRWARRRILLEDRTLVSHDFEDQMGLESSIAIRSEATHSGWRTLEAGEWPKIEAVADATHLKSASRIQRTVGTVRVEGALGTEFIERF